MGIKGISMSEFYIESRRQGLSYTDGFAMNLLFVPNALSIMAYIWIFCNKADALSEMCAAFKATNHVSFSLGKIYTLSPAAKASPTQTALP